MKKFIAQVQDMRNKQKNYNTWMRTLERGV